MGARSFSLDLNILNSFNQHGLDDLKNAKLMNRVDSKFLLPMAQLPLLLKGLKPHCSLLSINGNLLAQYENVYYDTLEFDFYHQHHNGKLNRVKVRRRCYADHDLAFFELKIKSNKSRTEKTRIKIVADIEAKQFTTFTTQQCLQKFGALIDVQNCNYQRLSLANEQLGERVTIDLNTEFTDLQTNNTITLDRVCIVELKQQKLNLSSPLYRVLKHNGLRPSSFSKYCLGTALLRPNEIKSNLFKPTLLALKRRHGVINEPNV